MIRHADILSFLAAIAPMLFASPGSAEDAVPQQVILTDGSRFSARVISLDATGRLTLQRADVPASPAKESPLKDDPAKAPVGQAAEKLIEAKPQTVPLEDLVAFGASADPRRGAYLLLSDGSRLAAQVLELGDDHLHVDHPLFGEVRIPLRLVRGVVLQLAADALHRDRLLDKIASARPGQDELLLDNGDLLTGAIASWEKGIIRFVALGEPGASPAPAPESTVAGPTSINVKRIRAVTFDPALADVAKLPPQRTLVSLRDGSLLVAAQCQFSADKASLKLACGVELASNKIDGIELPGFRDEIVGLRSLGRKVIYLSDLPEPSYKHIPFLELERPLAIDRSAAGTRLRAEGRLYEKGLGMPSTSRVAWAIPAGYRRFEAELAIDDQAARGGSVVFRVFLDDGSGAWKPAYKSPILRGGMAPTSVSFEFGTATQISLLVDFAERGDVLDYADWLDARLVK